VVYEMTRGRQGVQMMVRPGEGAEKEETTLQAAGSVPPVVGIIEPKSALTPKVSWAWACRLGCRWACRRLVWAWA